MLLFLDRKDGLSGKAQKEAQIISTGNEERKKNIHEISLETVKWIVFFCVCMVLIMNGTNLLTLILFFPYISQTRKKERKTGAAK